MMIGLSIVSSRNVLRSDEEPPGQGTVAANDTVFRNGDDKGNREIVHAVTDSNAAFYKQLRLLFMVQT